MKIFLILIACALGARASQVDNGSGTDDDETLPWCDAADEQGDWEDESEDRGVEPVIGDYGRNSGKPDHNYNSHPDKINDSDKSHHKFQNRQGLATFKELGDGDPDMLPKSQHQNKKQSQGREHRHLLSGETNELGEGERDLSQKPHDQNGRQSQAGHPWKPKDKGSQRERGTDAVQAQLDAGSETRSTGPSAEALSLDKKLEIRKQAYSAGALKGGKPPMAIQSTQWRSPESKKRHDEEMQAVLEEHNKYRALHNAPALRWSEQLVKNAERHLAGQVCGSLDHSRQSLTPEERDTIPGQDDLDYLRVGENLLQTTQFKEYAEHVTHSLWEWYDEKADYPVEGYTGGYQARRVVVDGKVKPTGHFTQMIWKSTQYVGCAASYCLSGVLRHDYLTCEYFPRGNVFTVEGQLKRA